jgi:tight adherence protein C
MLLVPLGAVMLLLCAGSLLWMRYADRSERLAERIRLAQGVRRADGPIAQQPDGGRTLFRLIARIGGLVTRSGLLPPATIAQLGETLVASGFSASNALGLFVGCKVLLLLSLPGIAAVVLPRLGLHGTFYVIAVSAAAIGGLLAPDYFVGKLRRQHLKRVEAGLADALDMLVICSEAGLGLEPALSRVGIEMREVHPALAMELWRTSSELQMITDSRIALGNMGSRTGLESMRRLGTTLIQTMQYGTPLSSALRVLSAELRQETLTRFEERAARLPTLLTLPMILFILPCVFMVVGGPAVLQVIKIMK